MANGKKVKGKLIESAYVGGKLCAKGETVEVREELAERFFGKSDKTAETKAKAKK